jgi:hypothetical protein
MEPPAVGDPGNSAFNGLKFAQKIRPLDGSMRALI